MSTTKQKKLPEAPEEQSLPDVISKTVKQKVAKLIRILTAVLLLSVGLIGIVLPFLHGLSFLLAGCIILSFDFPWVETKLRKYVSKNKTTEKMYNKLHKYLEKKFDKPPC